MAERSELLTFGNLQHGAAEAKVNQALSELFSNVMNLNTPWKTARKVTVTITVKPKDEDRQIADISVDVAAKLATVKPVESIIVIGETGNGEGIAQEYPSGRQLTLEDNLPEGVAKFPGKKSGQQE
jgi:cell division protein FtsX